MSSQAAPAKPSPRNILRAQTLAERAFAKLQQFLHIEAVGGAVLLVAAAIALIWANTSFVHSYHALWHLPVTMGIGAFVFSKSLHFWINDGLMTLFFLVVGMEIRREMHDGALRTFDLALLPVIAAIGGVVVPAVIYLFVNPEPMRVRGWAVPVATDIAFAVGVLALLGRSVPANVRIFLLALAIIDDVIAVLIIAVFYSGGLQVGGVLLAGLGIAMVSGLQRIGAGSAFFYVLPGVIVWSGFLMAGAHPTLAGVVLGLLTPVVSMPTREHPLTVVMRAASKLQSDPAASAGDAAGMAAHLQELRKAQREVLPPVIRVQAALHPWVAFGVMPLFALANAGVTLNLGMFGTETAPVVFGIAVALVAGKLCGIVAASWAAVRLGQCRLPDGVSWGGIVLIGLLAGIGFTMSIFIAMLAFADPGLLAAAKLGVLLGSSVAALLGLAWGAAYYHRLGCGRRADQHATD